MFVTDCTARKRWRFQQDLKHAHHHAIRCLLTRCSPADLLVCVDVRSFGCMGDGYHVYCGLGKADISTRVSHLW